MVDINICGSGPGCTVVRAGPASAGACARGVGHDVGTITLEDLFTRVAGSGLGDPVREQVARVAVLRALSSNSQSCELSAGLAGGGNVGRRASSEVDGCWGSRNESRRGDGEKDGGLHGDGKSSCNGRAGRWLMS